MKIKTEKEFRAYQADMESIIAKGTSLGDMELLSEEDKAKYIALSQAINEWESAYHPLPGKVSTLITDAIKARMEANNLKQKEAAKRHTVISQHGAIILSGTRTQFAQRG
jgi:HTH-type transcriptional regulator / antitoxin HigA